MSQGADSLLGNDGGETPLQMAVFVGDPDLVALFFGTMGAEASVPLRDRRGNTPLHYAASFNKLDLLAILVQHGGDIYVRNNDGCTVFLQSVVAGQKDVAAAILKCSPASLGDTDARGGNALHLICKNGAEGAAPMALWLLSVGVSVHARDEHNCLPLHCAAAGGQRRRHAHAALEDARTARLCGARRERPRQRRPTPAPVPWPSRRCAACPQTWTQPASRAARRAACSEARSSTRRTTGAKTWWLCCCEGCRGPATWRRSTSSPCPKPDGSATPRAQV
jgi:hypothetical protein